MNRIRYFEMFAGVGGFGQGIDGECVGLSEINKYASQVLKYHYPNVKNYGDCTKINWSEVPNFDLLTGGSPCQDFSIAGKRAGIKGARSGLVWEYIRCLEEKKPRYFIWENVKGVMSSRGGWDFANILTAFSEAGYSLWWQVLNAKDFGVPQNRERIFVIGFRDGCPPEVFFEPGADGKDIKVSGVLNSEIWRKRHEQIRRVHDPEGISPTLPTGTGGGVMTKIEVSRVPLKYLNRNQKKIEGDYAFTIDSMNTGGIIIGHSRDKTGKKSSYHIKKTIGTIKQPSGNQQDYVIEKNK